MKTHLLTTTIALLLNMGILPNAHADTTDGLVAHWSFDDCKATDNSGNGHDGTINGNPQCVDGVKGKAFSFDGVQDFIQVADTSELRLSGISYTFSGWAKLKTYNSSYQSSVISKRGNGNHNGYIWTLTGTLANGFPNGSPAMSISGGTDPMLIASNNTELGKWRSITVSYDVNTKIGKLYIDGTFAADFPNFPVPNSDTNVPLIIAKDNTDNYFLNGELDDLRLYNRALTEAEVLELYSGGGTTNDKNDELKEFIDLSKSIIDFKLKKAVITFTKPLTALSNSGRSSILSDYFESIQLKVGDKTVNWKFDDIKNQLLKNDYIVLDLPNLKNYPDKLVELQFLYTSKEVGLTSRANLQAVVDTVEQFAPDAIMSKRQISETKPTNETVCETKQGIKSACNDFFNTAETGNQLYSHFYGAAFQNTLTHRIVDFDKIVKKAMINSTWTNSSYGRKPLNDNGRIPLLLIHGWQGDKELRNPAKLGLWEYSELHYWQHFLDYYLTSPALQKKYHLYLYHYPSYKHVTYNASVLNDLLQEVGQTSPNTDLGRAMTSTATNTPQNNLTIVAHSMGGMVARSLIEEYQGLGDSKVYGASMNKLNKLITLDTPHHGSTASDPSSTLAKIPKDMLTQGAADLNWDNYDNQLQNGVVSNINQNYRWVSAEINNQEFDSKFCNAIDCNNTANPWLLNMNKHFETLTDSAKNKYVLYVAWMSNTTTSKTSSDALNPIANGFDYNFAEKVGIPDLPNGVAEPVTSALLSSFDPKTNTTLPFQPQCKNSFPVWFDSTIKKSTLADDFYSWQLYEESLLPEVTAFPNVCGITDTLSLERANFLKLHSILIPTESVINLYAHPYGLPYRIFWDYDHEKMVNGAYSGDLGTWDQFVLSKKFDAKVANKASAFHDNSLRNKYIYAASMYRDKKPFSISKNQVYDPLRAEPLYLILEGDLLKK